MGSRFWPVGAFFSLRLRIGLLVLFIWNVLGLFAIWLNGGSGKIKEPESFAVVMLLMGLFAAFCFAVAGSERLRGLVVEPKRAHLFGEGAFWFTGSVAVILFAAAWSSLPK